MLLTALPRLLKGAPIQLDRVSIFHTTDLHGHILPTSTYDGVGDLGGLARCASVLKKWKRMHPHHMLLDLGDLYQGTDVSLQTQGDIMLRCLNHLDYDGWVLGNHELDWGIEAVHGAVEASRMPVMAANVSMHDARVWKEGERERSSLLPYLIKEVNGYRIAVVAMTTPGMANWFLPELTPGFAAFDPVPVMGSVMQEVRAQKPDAVILACHMGVRPWSNEDDAANRLFALTKAFPDIDAILAGHTHRDQPERRVNSVPYSQANYFGIHLGHLELSFNRETRKLLSVRPTTELMDARYSLDPEVIALTAEDVEASAERLATPVGELAEVIEFSSSPGRPSDYERLIGSAIVAGLRKRDIQVDACLHGLLFTDAALQPGVKTVADMWEVIPFENFVVTASVTGEELTALVEESFRERNHRSLMGLEPTVTGRGQSLRVTEIRRPDGTLIREQERIVLALNSYDAASGGGRFPTLREILAREASKRTLHRLQSRALLVEYFEDHSPVRPDEFVV